MGKGLNDTYPELPPSTQGLHEKHIEQAEQINDEVHF